MYVLLLESMYYTLYSAHILALVQRTTTTSDYVLHTNDRLQKNTPHFFSSRSYVRNENGEKRRIAKNGLTRTHELISVRLRARVHAHPELQSLWYVIYLQYTVLRPAVTTHRTECR